MAEKTFSLEELSPEIQNGVINYLLNSDFWDSMEYELRWEEGPQIFLIIRRKWLVNSSLETTQNLTPTALSLILTGLFAAGNIERRKEDLYEQDSLRLH